MPDHNCSCAITYYEVNADDYNYRGIETSAVRTREFTQVIIYIVSSIMIWNVREIHTTLKKIIRYDRHVKTVSSTGFNAVYTLNK